MKTQTWMVNVETGDARLVMEFDDWEECSDYTDDLIVELPLVLVSGEEIDEEDAIAAALNLLMKSQ